MELVGSVLLVCLCLGSFGIIEGSIVSDIITPADNVVIPKITCSITNSSITFYHKGGQMVLLWELSVNNLSVTSGDTFKIGDTITFSPAGENCNIRLVGDGSLLFWCEL